MPLPLSTLSRVSRAIADFLSNGLDTAGKSIRLSIGNPASAVPKDTDIEHRVNLFFYRIEPSEFEADLQTNDPWRLRLHCLLTAFGVTESKISPGENDLRLLGEIIRLFHETPVMDPLDIDGHTVRLQVVLLPLSMDEINHLWATQGDAVYRLSVAYELALVPVAPKQAKIEGPRVAGIEYHAQNNLYQYRIPAISRQLTLPVFKKRIDTQSPNWTPHICFVYELSCAYTLSFETGSPLLTNFSPMVWVAGSLGADLTLVWEVWHAESGWAQTELTASVKASTDTIDPDLAATAELAAFELPFKNEPGQAMLYAIREYQRATDGYNVTVRSNPLLVTLYEVAA